MITIKKISDYKTLVEPTNNEDLSILIRGLLNNIISVPGINPLEDMVESGTNIIILESLEDFENLLPLSKDFSNVTLKADYPNDSKIIQFSIIKDPNFIFTILFESKKIEALEGYAGSFAESLINYLESVTNFLDSIEKI